MKNVFVVFCLFLAMACGDGSNREGDRDLEEDREAAAEEKVDIGAGENISPQLELDSADSTFEVDTVSSPEEVNAETEKESF